MIHYNNDINAYCSAVNAGNVPEPFFFFFFFLRGG